MPTESHFLEIRLNIVILEKETSFFLSLQAWIQIASTSGLIVIFVSSSCNYLFNHNGIWNFGHKLYLEAPPDRTWFYNYFYKAIVIAVTKWIMWLSELNCC